MTTKEKILKAALQLFNSQGVSSVTVRDIAEKLGMSHGNLCYHYPRVNDIILALYQEMSASVNDRLDQLEPDENLFKAHADAIRTIFQVCCKYKFFYLHIVEIMQRLPEIQKRHFKLIEERKIQIRAFWQILRDAGLFRKDLSNDQYEQFIDHCYLYTDFWISSAEIGYRGPAAEKLNYYVTGYLSLFIPYLTDRGKVLASIIL